MFGDKGTVDNYRTFEVLEVMSIERDLSRRGAWINRKLSKMMEAEAKAKR